MIGRFSRIGSRYPIDFRRNKERKKRENKGKRKGCGSGLAAFPFDAILAQVDLVTGPRLTIMIDDRLSVINYHRRWYNRSHAIIVPRPGKSTRSFLSPRKYFATLCAPRVLSFIHLYLSLLWTNRYIRFTIVLCVKYHKIHSSFVRYD